MNISVSRRALVNAMKRLSFITPSKTTMPILQYCLIKASKRGKVTLHATDLDNWVSVDLEGTETC